MPGLFLEEHMTRTFGAIAGILAAGISASSFAETVKQEPPMGAMREGQVLLVDDGSCPAGQIKRVVGGNHTKVGGTKQIVRTSSCVPR
jgi:CBS-domain-containing membrane protein